MLLTKKITLATFLSLGLLSAAVAQTSSITSFSPQGEVAQVRQIAIRFNEPMVPMGDPTAKEPVTLSCDPKEILKGQGRWVDEKIWVFDFEADLPVGVTCAAKINTDLSSVAGNLYQGEDQFHFNTGGPFVESIYPWASSYSIIAEDQAFLLRLNGDATAKSIKENMWCTSSSIGEKIPVTLIEGNDRAQLMDRYGWGAAAKKEPLQYWALQCQRRFSANDRVTLVYGAGVASPSGIPNEIENVYEFTVREPFSTSFTCTRENANAGCMPVANMQLQFNAQLPVKHAENIQLKSAAGEVFKAVIDKNDQQSGITRSVIFAAPFPEDTAFTIVLPSDIQDDIGRQLSNADQFPLQVKTDKMPSLAKFASAPFGVVELYAQPDTPPMVPITVRNIEAVLDLKDLNLAANKGTLSQINLTSDQEIIKWYRAVELLDSSWISYDTAASRIPQAVLPPRTSKNDWGVQTRRVSLLGKQNDLTTVQLPTNPEHQNNQRPLEVIGIPVQKPGYHVLELASPALGDALLREPGASSAPEMYVRTGVLVTNLAVHAKIGRESSLIWVTQLNSSKPVAGADVSVRGCSGEEYYSGKTDEDGLLFINKQLPEGRCHSNSWERFLFISARAQDEKAEGGIDMAFTLSNWYRGIEPWRFGYPTSSNPQKDSVATTVFDRTLLRAGETVHMKHFIRDLELKGFSSPKLDNVDTVKIVHQGSGQESVVPIKWKKINGGFSASSSFEIPKTAKLGSYRVFLIDSSSASHNQSYYYSNDRDVWATGSFQVEEFRLPVFEGNINVVADKNKLVRPKEIPLSLQINYLSGGGASDLPVQVSAVLKSKSISFPDYNFRFSFTPPSPIEASSSNTFADEYGSDYWEEDYYSEGTSLPAQQLIADKRPLKLDALGSGQLTLDQIPSVDQAKDLLVEASFADPNGEIVTLRHNASLWPSAVVVGIRNDSWVSITNSKIDLQAIALDTTGKPVADTPLEIRALERVTTSTRKRLVGGFYAYDSKTETKDLGVICSGKSDEKGLLTCEHKFTVGGNIELIATATDEAGLTSSATTSLWVTSRDELWFGGSDSDRIDLLPEQPTYQAGETARFQLRMPFRQATVLVTVEREGILESHVMELSGNNPTIELKVGEKWGPNIYVSALVLRGRLTEVPLYSFYQWGYKDEDKWWQEYKENADYAPPTAMVDLSKPAYRLGVAEIKVKDPAYDLNVAVKTNRSTYQIREKAKATISITYPDGTPAANADVALAVVDEALLELKSNNSWDLLSAMLQRRSWGVQTSTAQMEIIGRRHYGRKALPAGGGGGSNKSARELFETLLLWDPYVKLNAQGQAQINIPINDSLTTFRVVVIAADGSSRFGTGQVKFQSTQDLQLISGLPPVVRGDDDYRAAITVRNATEHPMKVEIAAKATALELKPKVLEIPANSAREAVWQVSVPAELAGAYEGVMAWEIEAVDLNKGAKDHIALTQRVLTGIPVTVRQATLKQLDQRLELPVQQPTESIEGRGGIRVSMVPRLADGLPAITDWFNNHYPTSNLEFRTSKALGTRNAQDWKNLLTNMPDYLDEDGLAYYFIPRSDVSRRGSDVLAAYILSASHEASKLDSSFKLSNNVQSSMVSGLSQFVEGKLQRNFWARQKDLEMRRLNAMEALSRYDAFKPRMLSTITIAPNQWPTTSVIQWLQILQRTPEIEMRDQRIEEAQQIIRSRLTVAGTRIGFSTENSDYWWWLMWNTDINAAQLLLAVLDEPDWQEDLPKLVTGFITRQQTGAWHTSIANVWGRFALEQFSRKFESEPIAGLTLAQMFDSQKEETSQGIIDWSKVARSDRHNDIGTDAPSYNAYFGAPSAAASFVNNSVFLPWPTPPQQGTVVLQQDGTGKPWATIQSLAAVPLKAPFFAGYQVTKTVTPINEQVKGKVSRGDIWRVKIEVDAQSDMTWVVINDPIPAGATIQGTGLGRDSLIALGTEVQSENTEREPTYWWNQPWLAYEEFAQDAYRAYYEFVPKGTFSMEYTVRLNNEGTFILPPTRVEATYAPEMFGEAPNANVSIQAQP